MKNSRIIILLCLCIFLVSGLACSLSGDETTIPSAPNLSHPDNGAIVNGTSITFSWQGSSDTTAYFLRVSNSTYPDLDHETSFFSDDVGSFPLYTVSGFPDDGTEYVWGIWSGNEAGWCLKSDVLSNRRIFTNGEAQ